MIFVILYYSLLVFKDSDGQTTTDISSAVSICQSREHVSINYLMILCHGLPTDFLTLSTSRILWILFLCHHEQCQMVQLEYVTLYLFPRQKSETQEIKANSVSLSELVKHLFN